MRLDRLDRHRFGTGPLHRLDARAKLVLTVAFVVATIATPVGAGRALAALGLALAFAVGLSGAPVRVFARRWASLFVMVAFLTAMVAPMHPARAKYGLAAVAGAILAKNGLALGAMLVLTATTPLPRLLTALRQLGVPMVLVATLQFMDRYRHVLFEELERMTTARRARSFQRRSGLSWNVLGGLIGHLFLRTFERAERVHGAMIARGWTGAVHHLEE